MDFREYVTKDVKEIDIIVCSVLNGLTVYSEISAFLLSPPLSLQAVNGTARLGSLQEIFATQPFCMQHVEVTVNKAHARWKSTTARSMSVCKTKQPPPRV